MKSVANLSLMRVFPGQRPACSLSGMAFEMLLRRIVAGSAGFHFPHDGEGAIGNG